MERSPIYLDHNATTPLLPEVVAAMLPYLREHFGNPSSSHAYGRRAREAVDAARAEVAHLLGCAATEVVFTSSGTEASNLAIRGVAEACGERRHIITSTIEHPATSAPCGYLEEHGFRVDRIGADALGLVRLEQLDARLSEGTALVTIMHANNETGSVQPIREIARVARSHGAVVHTDAAQSVGKLRVRVDDLGVDLLTLAGHKLNAPKGIGALYVRSGTAIRPLLLGAGHESGRRPGTENVASIVGLGVACALASERLARDPAGGRVRMLRDRLWDALRRGVDGACLNGHETQRLPNTLNVRFPGVSGNAVLAAAPEVAASTGSACHQGAESASPVLLAMGLSAEEALGAVRLSVGVTTTSDEVDAAAGALIRAWHRARGAA